MKILFIFKLISILLNLCFSKYIRAYKLEKLIGNFVPLFIRLELNKL